MKDFAKEAKEKSIDDEIVKSLEKILTEANAGLANVKSDKKKKDSDILWLKKDLNKAKDDIEIGNVKAKKQRKHTQRRVEDYNSGS